MTPVRTLDVDFLPRIGPYCHAAEAHGLVYLSGIVPVDVATGTLIRDDAGRATALVLANVGKLLAALDLTPSSVVKTTVYLADMADFAAMNEAYEQFFGAHRPARTCLAVKQLPADLPVEIEVVAAR